MGKKNRLYAKKPPLSAVDKFLYVFLMLFSVVSIFSIFVVHWAILEILCFPDPDVVAATSDALIYFLPFIGFFSLSLGIAGSIGFDKKQPIFGNKKFKPKGFEPTKKVYPLFSREFLESLTYKEKRILKIATAIVAVLLVVSAVIIPFGIYRRKTLDSSDVVCSYNLYNKVTHSARVEDADKMTVTVTKATRSLASYGLNISFDFGNNRYIFGVDSFDDMTRKEVLEYMLKLKELCPDDKFFLNRADRLENLIAYDYFTPAEKSLVYELFDVTE